MIHTAWIWQAGFIIIPTLKIKKLQLDGQDVRLRRGLPPGLGAGEVAGRPWAGRVGSAGRREMVRPAPLLMQGGQERMRGGPGAGGWVRLADRLCFPFPAGLPTLTCIHQLLGCFSGRFQSPPSEAFRAELVFPRMLLCVSCACRDHACGVLCVRCDHTCAVMCACRDHACGVCAFCDHTCGVVRCGVVCALCEYVCGVVCAHREHVCCGVCLPWSCVQCGVCPP